LDSEKGTNAEIREYLRLQGKRCLKITPHSFNADGSQNFLCTVVSPAGKKETVLVHFQNFSKPDLSLEKTHCLI